MGTACISEADSTERWRTIVSKVLFIGGRKNTSTSAIQSPLEGGQGLGVFSLPAVPRRGWDYLGGSLVTLSRILSFTPTSVLMGTVSPAMSSSSLRTANLPITLG
jgi:hypothetical protein